MNELEFLQNLANLQPEEAFPVLPYVQKDPRFTEFFEGAEISEGQEYPMDQVTYVYYPTMYKSFLNNGEKLVENTMPFQWGKKIKK